MNLYCVYPRNDYYVCYVFAETRNKAKASLVGYFYDEEYIDFNAVCIKKNVGGIAEVCDIDCKRLADLGIEYLEYEN